MWPASLALARVLVHCPSFTAGRRCLEIGAGLGLVSIAACTAGAAEACPHGNPSTPRVGPDSKAAPRRLQVIAADRDPAALRRIQASESLLPPGSGSLRSVLADWSTPCSDAWPTDVDVVLASDVLYDADTASRVAEVLAHVMAPSGKRSQAFIADPEQRPNRDAFVRQVRSLGFDVGVSVLPGPERCVLLVCTRVS